MKIKFLLSVGLLSGLLNVALAQDSQLMQKQWSLATFCKEESDGNKVCYTRRNGKLVREIAQFNSEVYSVRTYYASGRVAKTIIFDRKGQLEIIFVGKDEDNKESEYKIAFKDGKYVDMSIPQGKFWGDGFNMCKEDTPNGKKCDELNYFYPSPEPDLHPAFALPIENQGLDVLKSNGIKIP